MLPRHSWISPLPRLVALALLATTLACTTGGVRPDPRPVPTAPAPWVVPDDLTAVLPFDQTLIKERLPNGLTYYVQTNYAPEGRAELWLVVDAGSILETDEERGLAHFVEHMAFNGTRRFERQELVTYLESIGLRFGPDVNATTGYDETIYMLRVPTDGEGLLMRGLDILEDWTESITFDPDEVESERGILIEEWRLGRGAGGRLLDAMVPVLFSGSRYAERRPGGTREVLESATPAALERFWRQWYRPELLAVIAVGDFEPRSVERAIRERFSDLENPPGARPRESFPVPEHAETLFAAFTDPELTAVQVSIYTKVPRAPQDTVGDYRRTQVERLYHAMLNDRLYEVGHQADPPFLYAASESEVLVRTAEVDQQEAGVRPGEVLRGLEALLAEVERVRRHGFTAGELERVKTELLAVYQRTYEARGNRSSASYAAEYSRNFLDDEPVPGIGVEVAMMRHLLPGITLEEVNALAGRRTSGANRVILVSGPTEAAATLPSEEELLAVFEQVQEKDLEPYRDQGPPPDLPEPPAPGEIVARKEIPEIGVTEWTLSNGIRVVLKPTDFRRDQVLLTASSPGGHSLVPDEDFLSASYAAEIVSLGGLAGLGEIELARALAGKAVQINPYIDELEEGIQAASSPEDFETMLRLVHLALTEPRLDRDAVASWKARVRPFIEGRLANPDQLFLETMFSALTRDHPRRRPLTPERLDALDLDAALATYRDRFADLGDAIFVITGNVSPRDIELPVRTYLATLPTGARRETWRDVGLERPLEPVELVVEQGLEPRAKVWLVLYGDAPWSLAAAHDLSTLGDVLEMRLRDVLREDLGAVYGVQVTAELNREPRERYSLSIQFVCDPERTDELVAAVRRELARLRDEGPDPELLVRVREIQIREHQAELHDNGFWLGSLAAYYERGDDPRTILDYAALVASTDVESLHAAARRYLDWDRRALGVLLPAKAE